LHIAPDSPWKRRATEHVHELSALELPQDLSRTSSSSSTVDMATVLPVVRKAMPAMRACLAKLPNLALTVTLDRVGPITPDSARDRPRYKPHAASTTVAQYRGLDWMSLAGEEAAQACVKTIAERLPVPLPKERDTWYGATFLVVAP
jgi:hypothetical protein